MGGIGVGIVEGHDYLAEVLSEEQTLLVDRLALADLTLLSWDLGLVATRPSRRTRVVAARRDRLVCIVGSATVVPTRGMRWQEQLFMALRQIPVDTGMFEHLLWSLLPDTRAARLRLSLAGTWPDVDPFMSHRSAEERLWQVAAQALAQKWGRAPLSPEQWAVRRERFSKTQKAMGYPLPVFRGKRLRGLCVASWLALFMKIPPQASRSAV